MNISKYQFNSKKKVKYILTLFLIFVINKNYSQNNNIKKANFEAIIELKNATKEGVYLNGYVVNISYSELVKLDGKKVRIKGKVTIVEGVKYSEKQNVRNKVILHEQGRSLETKLINKPKIEILN